MTVRFCRLACASARAHLPPGVRVSARSSAAFGCADEQTCRRDGNYAFRVSRMVVRSLQALTLISGLMLLSGCGNQVGEGRPEDGPSSYLKLDRTSDIDEMDAYCAAEPDAKVCRDR